MRSLILYADILGYGDLVKKSQLNDIHRIQNSLIKQIKSFVDKLNDSIRFAKNDKPQVDFLSEGNWGIYFAFDTLVFYFKDISDETYYYRCVQFTMFCSWIYCFALCNHQLKLRGLIFSSNDYIIEGEHLIIREIGDIYKRERLINFSGIRLDIPDFLSNSLEYNNWVVAPPDEPFVRYIKGSKDGYGDYDDLNVPFYLTPLNRDNLKDLRKLNSSYLNSRAILESEMNSSSIDSRAKEKISNTLAFLSHCENHYNNAGPLFYAFEKTTKIDLF